MISLMKTALFSICFLIVVQTDLGLELDQPFKVLVDGIPIDVDIGHAAPCWVDFDGDGLKDLLVGQFGGGRLRVYQNIGTPGAPRFSDFFYFQAAGADGTIPAS